MLPQEFFATFRSYELNSDGFNVFICKKYYSKIVRVLADQHISRVDC